MPVYDISTYAIYVSILYCPFLFFSTLQFAETYRNLQNTNRRHLNVHEPLIYDAVWLTAEALNVSLPTLSEGNLTLNSTQRNVDLISVLKSTLENNTYNGLTVRCTCWYCWCLVWRYICVFTTATCITRLVRRASYQRMGYNLWTCCKFA